MSAYPTRPCKRCGEQVPVTHDICQTCLPKSSHTEMPEITKDQIRFSKAMIEATKLHQENEKLSRQLATACEALEFVAKQHRDSHAIHCIHTAQWALTKMDSL